LLQAHRRYVNSFEFAVAETVTNKTHAMVLFNDILVIVKNNETKKPLIDHIFPLAEVFVREIQMRMSNILHTLIQHYFISFCLEKRMKLN
jgi:hypothetical protein